MQYKSNTKIIIDKRKLDVLIRLGCPDKQILDLIKTGTFEKTGDRIIDETLECLVDIKEFDNWGGKRSGAGRPKKNQDDIQDENQLDNQDGNQDAIQVVDKDIDKDRDNINKIIKILNKNNNYNNKILVDDKLNLLNTNDPDIKLYIEEYGYKLILDVQNWLLKTKKGKEVEKEYIVRQFRNFAYRQGVIDGN